ncbi:hypothetical protein GLOIN_2v1881393 [Rhizophagus irregularis DAOM 181602=DAOM 197198]|nr:hypothetical protein GLOIN_2v1881393 [Rhizophagus irregularis DAOM 181602=DAOM 197198]
MWFFVKNTNPLEWYRGDTVKERKDRDRWRLTRDLTAEEMEECKNNEYEFVKKMNYDLSISKFSKILKVSKNWKIIAYLKPMEQARRGETREESGLTKVDKEKMKEKLKTNNEEKLNEHLLETPLQRVFSGLDGIMRGRNGMEAIEEEACKEFEDDRSSIPSSETSEWLGKVERIIKTVESHDVIQKFTMLNNDFTKS